MRYNQNYQCKGCGAEAIERHVDQGLDCLLCGGRVWVKTVQHRAPVTVDDERFMPPLHRGITKSVLLKEPS